MLVFMVNSIGLADRFVCAGRSLVLNKEGVLLSQLDDTQEGILVVGTQTECVAKYVCD